MCVCSNFFHIISRGIYSGLFRNSFLDLSLISRFLYTGDFPAIGEIDCPGGR
jgi:hypothetical protein